MTYLKPSMSLASDGLRSSGPVAGGMAQCTKESAHLAKQIGVFWLQWGCFLLIRESDNCSLLREAVCHSFVVSFFILGGGASIKKVLVDAQLYMAVSG